MAACPRVASAGGWVIRGLRGGFARSTLIPCSASATEKAYISRTQPSFFLDSGSASIWAVNRSQSGVTCNAPNNVQTLCCAVLCCAVLCCAVLCCSYPRCNLFTLGQCGKCSLMLTACYESDAPSPTTPPQALHAPYLPSQPLPPCPHRTPCYLNNQVCKLAHLDPFSQPHHDRGRATPWHISQWPLLRSSAWCACKGFIQT